MHGVFADTQRGGQFAATPVGGPVAGSSPRGGQDAGAPSGSQHTGFLAGMIGVQSFDSGLPEALLPANDGGGGRLELPLDRAKGTGLRPASESAWRERRIRRAKRMEKFAFIPTNLW
jgi:hypothetical protein